MICSMKYGVCCVGFMMEYLTESRGLRKRGLWYNDLWRVYLGERLNFVFSPDFFFFFFWGGGAVLKPPTN